MIIFDTLPKRKKTVSKELLSSIGPQVNYHVITTHGRQTMLAEPKCYTRRCKHFLGVKWYGDEESTENNYCTAFPDGIPQEIAYGDNKHLKPLLDQGNEIVYEKELPLR
jgi:hypothetical protein